MSIYAISDLHLAFEKEKPMNVFGDNWQGHEIKIKKDWLSKVKENDLVLLPGDFSWANTLEETYPEFKYLDELPGKKILLKGNHDYWWNTLKKMRKYLKENNFNSIDFLHNNSYFYENYIIVGTRGWINSEEENNVITREYLRLRLSLEDGIKKYGADKKIIVCMHYPPFGYKDEMFVKLMNTYNVEYCIYGHLHGKQAVEISKIQNSDIKFKLVSCDYLNFKVFDLIC